MAETKEKPKQKDAEAKKPKPPTISDRMDRIEAAFTAALGRPLHEFDSPEVKRAREQVRLDAEEQAREIVAAAVEKAVKPLTDAERLDRIEQIVTQSLNIPVE